MSKILGMFLFLIVTLICTWDYSDTQNIPVVNTDTSTNTHRNVANEPTIDSSVRMFIPANDTILNSTSLIENDSMIFCTDEAIANEFSTSIMAPLIIPQRITVLNGKKRILSFLP